MIKKNTAQLIKKLAIYILLIGISAVMIVPFLWMISTALKADPNVFRFPPQWIPNPLVWTNFMEIWKLMPLLLFFQNSLIITFACIVGVVISSSLVAYGFARLRFPGRDILFTVLIATMMISMYVVLIPRYLFFNSLGWIDTFLPFIVPSFFGVGAGGGAFNIFLLRQFMLSIPKELEDAAMIDGCNRFRIYYKIVLPQVKPALAALTIFTFMYYWNDFLEPLIFLNSESRKTLALGIAFFTRTNYYFQNYNYVMAMTIITVIPCIIVFFVGQKYLMQGVVTTGLKG